MSTAKEEGLDCGDRECNDSKCWAFRRATDGIADRERRRVRRALRKVFVGQGALLALILNCTGAPKKARTR